MNPILHGLSLLKESAVIAGLHVIAGVMHEGKQLAMTGVQRYSGAVYIIPGTAFSKEGSTVSV